MPRFKRLAYGLSAVVLSLSITAAHAACVEAFMSSLSDYENGNARKKSTFAINEQLVICFTVGKSGYVKIMDAPAKGDFEQIYPNQITHPDGATFTRIEGGRRYCLGGRDTFPMYHPADEGVGQGKVSIEFTERSEHQLNSDEYAIPGRTVKKEKMELHLSSHSRSTGSCTAREVEYLNYNVVN